ncbi:hypothetical protein ACFV4K_30890 [Nocardia sp. NPDC059764]|uniref:hypothetical protein n=1 Tax=Nocardia sp. NPDC059764 TaxID=3346939 RepID=UPI00364D5AD4
MSAYRPRTRARRFHTPVAEIRRDSGQVAVDQAVETAIADYPSSPDWPVLTGEQRRATLDGTRDAATEVCPEG